MDTVILAAEECDVANEVICAPSNVNLLFELPKWFDIGPFEFTRTSFLMFLAAAIVVGILWAGLRKPKLDRKSVV